MPDFYNKTTNKCIEFFGDYWHANPKYFSPNQFIPTINKTAQEMWKHDDERLKSLKNEYNVEYKIIWETDRNNEKLLDELIKWVYEID